MNSRKAFTLIELLVVIAIIAILAAILFPVFAQAKAAAKGSASLSNIKQQSLGVIMYNSDYDDMNPIATTWNTGSDQLCYGGGLCFSTWAWVVQPYMKNHQLFMDPLATANGPSNPQRNFDTYYIQYGYNHMWLSPDYGSSPGSQTATSATSFAAPAETVMLASKWANKENTSGSDWGTGFPGGVLAAAVVDAPECFTSAQWCLYGWGGPGFYDTTLKLNLEAGGRTGGVSLRSSKNAVIAWLDGHAKKSSPGALAAGTNWSATAAGGVVVNNKSKYVWDNE